MQPLVSICIPTFNRAEQLRRTIEAIVHQAEFLSGEVEVVISDNASADDTEAVCRNYLDYPNFIYHRNAVNVMDRNFPIVLSKATGKLRKLNNDTFILQEGALRRLCDLVLENEKDRPIIYLPNKGAGIKMFNFHDFVMDASFGITWIACHTYWEDECRDIADDVCGCELRLWQVRKTYALAYAKDRVLVMREPIGESVVPPKKDISYGLYKVFYENYFKLLEPYIANHSISIADQEELEKQLLFGFFVDWIVRYEAANLDLQYSKEENLKHAVENQYHNKPYWKQYKRVYKQKKLKEIVKYRVKRLMGKA